MTVLAVGKDSTVMEYGDVGDNFYLIMLGKVDIQIPDYDKTKRFKLISTKLSES